MEYAIETMGLTKDYKGFLANDHVDIKVPKGSIFGLIGRNGAGKTTFMKLVLGFNSVIEQIEMLDMSGTVLYGMLVLGIFVLTFIIGTAIFRHRDI